MPLMNQSRTYQKRYFHFSTSPQHLKLRYNGSKVSNTRLQNIQFDKSKMSGNITDMQMWHNPILKIFCVQKSLDTLIYKSPSGSYNMTIMYTTLLWMEHLQSIDWPTIDKYSTVTPPPSKNTIQSKQIDHTNFYICTKYCKITGYFDIWNQPISQGTIVTRTNSAGTIHFSYPKLTYNEMAIKYWTLIFNP